MLSRIKSSLQNIMNIKPVDQVPEHVARHFKHNVRYNTLDMMCFFFSDSFWSISTIMPVFASNLTDSPFLIALIPAIVNAGWFLPQMFMAGTVASRKRVFPLARKVAIAERIPYLFFPLLALLIPLVTKSLALTLLFVLLTWRGFAGGISALPWQELMARVIPISHRSRFYGISRVLGQVTGILGSAVLGIILLYVAYPYNYAIGFGLAVVVQWISFWAYSHNREPVEEESEPEVQKSSSAVNFALFAQILCSDANFRRYLAARSISFLGNMGSAFISVYGISRFSLSDESAAIFTGLLFASGIGGYALWGALGDRIGPKRIVFYSFTLWALALVLAVLSPNIWVYYLVFILFGIYGAGMNVGDSILVMELGSEDQRPAYLGLARTITGVFLLLAPVLSGLLVKNGGYPVMFYVACGFMLVACWLIWGVRDRDRQFGKK